MPTTVAQAVRISTPGDIHVTQPLTFQQESQLAAKGDMHATAPIRGQKGLSVKLEGPDSTLRLTGKGSLHDNSRLFIRAPHTLAEKIITRKKDGT